MKVVLATAACAVLGLLRPDGAAAQSPDRPIAQSPDHQITRFPDFPGSLLEVPYLAQPPELCGGAAASMVIRYWGGSDVFPGDFAPLVEEARGGITTGALAAAVRDRGWQAFVLPSGGTDAERSWTSHLAAGRPLIALVEVSPGSYHYVVVVGATKDGVVVHDPARAPYEVMPWTAFETAWQAAQRWMLLVLPATRPSAGTSVARHAASPAEADRRGCQELVDAGVGDARARRPADAERRLRAASEICPASAAPWRELAGLRFAASNWTGAAAFADRATRLAPEDPYGWQLLATSRFLAGDAGGALAAWNQTGTPTVDVVTVTGAERTRRPIVVDALGLEPREVLTPAALGLATRRLRAVPVFTGADVRYTVSNGEANVEAVVIEPPIIPHEPLPLAALALRPLFVQDVQIDIAGPTGGGERWTTLFRWPDPRRRFSLALATPAPGPLPGAITVEGVWERQTYDIAGGEGGAVFREGRRRGSVELASWAASWLRWTAGAAVDHLRDASYVSVEGGIDARFAADHAALAWREAYWQPTGVAEPFSRATLYGAWRSTTQSSAAGATVFAEASFAGRSAPFAIWPGADSGLARDALIRAHPLLDDDIVKSDGMIGRRLVAATVAYERPIRTIGGSGVGLAGFIDLARASRRAFGPDAAWQADVGVGGRFHAPGLGGTARLDLAVGLRDGHVLVSAGWAPQWGRW